MVKRLATPKKIICFPRQGLQREALGDQWSGMVSRKSHKYTVSGMLPPTVSLILLGQGSELKNWMLEQPEKTKSASSIQFLLKAFS